MSKATEIAKAGRLGNERIEAIMKVAQDAGLFREKSARIGGRVSAALIEQAKQHTGIATDTELIEFALANIALDDGFAAAFRKTHGTVDPSLRLGY